MKIAITVLLSLVLICSVVFWMIFAHAERQTVNQPETFSANEKDQVSFESFVKVDANELQPFYSDNEAKRVLSNAKILQKQIDNGTVARPTTVFELLSQLKVNRRKIREEFPVIGGATEWRTYQISPRYSLYLTIRLPDDISFQIIDRQAE